MRMTKNWTMAQEDDGVRVTLDTPFEEGKSMVLHCGMTAIAKGRQLWDSGVLVQKAFPMLTADEREFLMTGMTPEEWEESFGEE